MKQFRLEAQAAIYFTVQAEDEASALKLARRCIDENLDYGWDVDLAVDGKFTDSGGRAFFADPAVREASLVVVDEDEVL